MSLEDESLEAHRKAKLYSTREGAAGGDGTPAWLEEDVATALAVARLLGVPDGVAREAMARAAADPGAFREGTVAVSGRKVPLLDARAANDPESFALLCAGSPALGRAAAPLAVYNHRGDRPDRLRRFAPSLAALPGASVVVTGDRPALPLARAFRREAGRELEFVPVRGLGARVSSSGAGAVVLCGNTRGLPVSALCGAPSGG